MASANAGLVAMAGPAAVALSVVVPTRNEAANVAELCRRLEYALGDLGVEVIFVDDSTDDTPDVVCAVGEQAQITVRLIHRPPEQRSDGLAGAVVEGLRAARGSYVCVMDADLQHPPELVPELLERATVENLDVVVASRHCTGGGADDFGPLRTALSAVSTGAARLLFPQRLRNVTDPMSGFFVLRRDAVDVDRLRPRGFKILLELLLRTPGLRVAETPFRFGTRFAGDSKAGLREGGRYLAQLLALRFNHPRVGRLARFGLVGASGLLVNMLVLAALTELAGFYYLGAAVLATQASTAWNFLLTERWVFRERSARRGVWRRAGLFFGMNNVALLLRGPLLFVLVSLLGLNYLVSNLLSLVALTVARFAIADGLIWARPRLRRAVHYYDIHGLVTVESDVALPELAFFRTDSVTAPTISVRIKSNVGQRPSQNGQLSYREPFGFAVEIDGDEQLRVHAAPLLARSPHVLYTNVVEPLLRWTFVNHGFALVHGACIANDAGLAYLITARTDTGKTTTILRTLGREPYGFLADDLCLVAADGRVLSYPKPLTISSHTVSALGETDLTWLEHLRLIYQSRIHSRSGRRFAFLLTRYRLPVATINALVQLLVPPPKYSITRLIPGVRVVDHARLAGMLVISRTGDRELPLEPDEALQLLLTNCADAYGFPPYEKIEAFMFSRHDVNLRRAEQEIIAAALAGRPARLLESTNMNWWERLATLMANLPSAVGEALAESPIGGELPAGAPSSPT